MKCAVCIYLNKVGEVLNVAAATTAVRGTALCDQHAVEKMGSLSVLQDLGLR